MGRSATISSGTRTLERIFVSVLMQSIIFWKHVSARPALPAREILRCLFHNYFLGDVFAKLNLFER